MTTLVETFDIAGYCRISVDEELDRENTSIENQKRIIEDYVKTKFPESTLNFYEDRDRSGYTFEQREGYQKLRPQMISHKYDILIVKDFSRFSRRNSKGLVELEDLRDIGMRIISIGDGIDYPTYDDWTAIQFRFLINEMPVTDASKKVKSVIKHRQSDGRWICAVPYGYVITNNKMMTFEIDKPAAAVVQKVFQLYNAGWGYKKIANFLTDKNIPTPRMCEKARKEAKGEECRIKAKKEWSIITVEGILRNDFYIGTLRQGKYTRKKINGSDIKRDVSDHIVFENHHEPIVDYRTFAIAQEQLKRRTNTNYRGIKINDNIYSGSIFCGDCGSPMFAMSRRDLRAAYTCGTYHRRGLAGCTSHHVRVDVLDELLRLYIKKLKDSSREMIDRLNDAIKDQASEMKDDKDLLAALEKQIEDAKEELKATKRQKIREIMKRPEQEALLEETFTSLEEDLDRKIDGLQNQLKLTSDKHNTTVRVSRIAKTALDVFDDILNKNKLSKHDIELIVERILVYEDRIEVQLQRDIEMLLTTGGTEIDPEQYGDNIEKLAEVIVQSSMKRRDKVYFINVVRNGDPLEIYTEKDGEVIFKKYSPMGEWSDSANQICETLYKTAGCNAAVADRDTYISACGVPKRELTDKHISSDVEQIMEARRLYQRKSGEKGLPVIDSGDKYVIETAAPIISEGDVMGCVIFFSEGDKVLGEVEYKLAQTVAGFLGKQMES